MNLEASQHRRSAVVPFRRHEDKLQILLITSRNDGRWIIPKGRIEPGLLPAESAAKEAIEEAGVAGELFHECLGIYPHPHGVDVQEVEVYALQVESVRDHWLEEAERKRDWFSLTEAVTRLEFPKLRQIILAWARNGAGRIEPAELNSNRPALRS